MKIAVIISDGTEELEVLTPVDILRRANVECDLISVCDKITSGSHNVKIVADKLLTEVDLSSCDGIIIPGGMPGASIISEKQPIISAVKKFLSENKLVASICASPAIVLAKNHLIDGRKATCYPAKDFIKLMENTTYTCLNVQVDGNLITANGPRSALEFSMCICDFLGVKPNF